MNLATHVIAQQHAESVPRRGLIGFLLLHRIEWSNRHPGLMLVAVGLLIVLQSVLEQLL